MSLIDVSVIWAERGALLFAALWMSVAWWRARKIALNLDRRLRRMSAAVVAALKASGKTGNGGYRG